MSGVFGWISSNPTDNLEPQIGRMAKSLTHRTWIQVDTTVAQEDNAAFGRTGVGVFNKDPQPAQRKEGMLNIWFAGEFFRHNISNYDTGWNTLPDPELALLLYDKLGEAAFSQYEGSFQCCIWNKEKGLTYLVTDRYSTFPLFYYYDPDKFLFAPEFKAILTWPEFKKKTDMDALTEYVRMQRLLGTKTFFENIHRLRYASFLKYSHHTNQIQIEKYWDFDNLQQFDISPDEGIEEFKRLLNAAVKRSVVGEFDSGLYLSGGLDSRMIASTAVKYRKPFHTLTYGLPDSADALLANMVAKKLGTIHHFIPFNDGKWVLNHFDDHLNLTEGFHSWPHLHGISTIDYAREHFQIQLNGFLGGLYTTYTRTAEKLGKINKLDEHGVLCNFYQSLITDSSWPGLNEGEAVQVYHPQIKKQMRDRAYYSFLREFELYTKYSPPIHLQENLSIIENAMTLYHKFVIFYRAGLEVRCPFLDYDLIEFILSAPAEIRLNVKQMVQTIAPEVANIPYNKDMMPPTTNKLISAMAEFNIKSASLLNRIKPGLIKIPNPLNTDYEEYLRTDLKDWAEGILLDDRTLSRGIFNPDFIRSIWSRTLNGEVHTLGKLSPILSYELILRKFYDD